MAKPMCKRSREEIESMKLKEAVYWCKSCKREAHKEKQLCKPKKIKKEHQVASQQVYE